LLETPAQETPDAAPDQPMLGFVADPQQ
jgi:hypothetical protein